MLRLSLYRLFSRLPAYRGKARIDAWIRRGLFPEPVFVLPGGLSIRLGPREWAQNDLLTNGCTEPLTLDLLRRLLGPGDAFVDVGCHIGYHAMMARSFVGAGGRVVAIDPQPYNAERTLENFALNGFGNVVVYVAALGGAEEPVRLTQPPPTDRSRLSLLDGQAGTALPGYVVPVFRLDTILWRESLDRVAVLKIDTEGYELEVLKGAGERISGVDHIILELLPAAPSAYVEDLLQLLTDRFGMKLSTVEGKPWAAGQVLPENNLWASRHA